MKRLAIFCLLAAAPCLAQSTRPIYQAPHYTLSADQVVQGEYSARALSPTEIESNYNPTGGPPQSAHWKLQADLSRYPQFHSTYPLIDALYNMALEELQKDTRPDGALMAGAKWEGVWTRDVSFSTLLSLAIIAPEAAKRSLLAKVKRDRIVQDTGTGGSWPCSSDRMTWALAAWEIFQVTGDRDWLRKSFTIIRNSADDDEHVVFSRETGLALGESSFLDWREQTYPRWMEPADIYSAQALGTNAVHYRTYEILASMARLLGEPDARYIAVARRIRSAMNRLLWIESRAYYGQYLYGRDFLSLSPRSEALGEALTILFDIPEPARQDSMLKSVPVMEYGIPSVYPETPGIPPYHNNAVWPFVQAFWNLAAAKRQDGSALVEGMTDIYRAAALFLTDKENMVADSGSPVGTEINSDRQLWSVAGNLAMVYRVLIGMEFQPGGILLHPVIPAEFSGSKQLANFQYRNAVLSFEIEGHGATIRSVTLDGRPARPFIPAGITGSHTIKIRMADDQLRNLPVDHVDPLVAPDTPIVEKNGDRATWNAITGATSYRMYRNSKPVATTQETSFTLPAEAEYSEYQVSAVSGSTASFESEPIVVSAPPVIIKTGDLDLTRTTNTDVVFDATLPVPGRFAIAFRYANGSGPINTENKCAIRTLFVDGKFIGAIVFPQRGTDKWSDWGLSSRQIIPLSAGAHKFELRFEPYDENMNPDVNRALLDRLQLTRIE
ncbi:MAG: hypothetical protein WB992_05305 [Bryobacteraceae bacterium]